MPGFSATNTVIQGKPIYQFVWLLNGTNANMTVNGSVATPVDFTFTPAGGLKYFLSHLYFYADAGSVLTPTNFMSGGALTNGLLITVKTNGNTQDYDNLQSNFQIFGSFNATQGTGATILLVTNQRIAGTRTFDPDITLDATQTDFVRARVRDNLSAFNFIAIGALICQFKGD